MNIFNKNLPTAVIKKETPICKQLKAQIALTSPINVSNNFSFIFYNKLFYFDTILNIDGRVATIEELVEISKYLYVQGQALCPMPVWAIRKGSPVIVMVKPGHKNPVKLININSKYCLAYAILIPAEE